MDDFLLSGLRKLVAKTADEFDPALLSGITATQAIEEWATIEKIACAQKLRAASRAEDVGFDAEGIVGEASGVPTNQARRQTRTARKAKGKTKDAFEKGKLSATQAGAIADAVETNPAAEQNLLDLAATGSTTDLLKACAEAKRAGISDADLAARQKQARFFRSWKDAMGMVQFRGALTPLEGAKLLAELERRSDRLFRAQSKAKGPIDTTDQRMADALSSLLDDSGQATNGRRTGPRTVVRLIVTKAAAERGWAEPGEKCETAEGDPIPMGAVDEVLLHPDTLVQQVEIDEIDVRSIKKTGKYIPRRIRDALEARGVCCVVPGCGRTKWLQIDHTEERRDGGITELLNLGWLCLYHHRLKTRRLYDLWRDDAGWHWEPARARAPA